MKLLVVDDNADTRKLIRSIMKPRGHDVLESGSGSEALALYATYRPDCVLMDVEMPGVDGIEATAMMKTKYPDARVVILTMFDDDRLRSAAARAGAEHYVLKDDIANLHTILGK